MTKLLRVPFIIPVGDHRILQPVITRAGRDNLEIFLRKGDEGGDQIRIISVELSQANAARLHGDLTRALGLDTPTVEYHERSLHDVVERFRAAHPATFTIKPGVEMDRVMEVPDDSPLGVLRYVGEHYGLNITVHRIATFEDDGRVTGEVIRAYEVTISRNLGHG